MINSYFQLYLLVRLFFLSALLVELQNIKMAFMHKVSNQSSHRYFIISYKTPTTQMLVYNF